MPEVEANGIRLHYEERGEGLPILCVHGMGSSSIAWMAAMEPLSSHGRAIVYDRRGCARSERPEPYDSVSAAEQADDAAALLDTLDAAPAVVVGRSYGGYIALQLALRHPGHVRALALLEPDAPGLSRSADRWVARFRDRVREAAASDGVDAVGPILAEEAFGEGAWEALPEELRRTLTGNGPAILAEIGFSGEHPSADELASLELPVLLLAATESPLEFREGTEALAEALPNARLVRVGGGHMIDPASPEVLELIEQHA